MNSKRSKVSYSAGEKYIIACGHLEKRSHTEIASEIGREPIDVYQALRTEWARSLCYAICRERGENERDTELRWG